MTTTTDGENQDSRQAARDRFAERCHRWADGTAASGFPGDQLYVPIVRGMAADPAIIDIALEAPPAQQVAPNLLLAAVHFLLQRGIEHPLAARYADEADTTDPYPLFRDFCLTHRDAVTALVRVRATQTNEVRRSLALWPALVIAAREAGRPLALVDIGASAGLNLQLAHFAYAYHGAGGDLAAGTPGATIRLDTDLRGSLRPPLTPGPTIGYRAGIDASPLDITDADDADWLRACLWPGDHERATTLDRAIRLAQQNPAPMLASDAVTALEQVIASVPVGEHLCIMHTYVLAYLTGAQRAAFRESIVAASRQRPITWISFESPGTTPGVIAPARPGVINAEFGDTCVLAMTTLGDGQVITQRTLALCHPHVRWLEWLDGETADTVERS